MIEYLFLTKKTDDEIEMEQTKACGDSATSLTSINYRTAEFKRDRRSDYDEDRQGHLNGLTISEMIEEIY